MTAKEAFDITIEALRKEGLKSDEIIEVISNMLNSINEFGDSTRSKKTYRETKERKVRELLLKIGITRNIKGYNYLVEAILLYDEDTSKQITGYIYPKVAEKFNSTKERVERAIRHAIEKCFNNMDAEAIYFFFGNTVGIRQGKPTNAEFIALCSEWLNR